MMKKNVTLLMTTALVLSWTACANASVTDNVSPASELSYSNMEDTESAAVNGESLTTWDNEAGWTAFYTFTQDENLNDAWNAAAKAFGPVIGLEDLNGDGLKAMNVQVCGMEDDITRFEFDDNAITAIDSTGSMVFSHKYTYTATIDNAIEGAAVYVYRTDESDAGKYTYLCMTAPAVESDEGGVMTYFRLRYTADNYEDLFAEDYSGVTGVMADGETTEEDLDYTIRLLYGEEVKNQ